MISPKTKRIILFLIYIQIAPCTSMNEDTNDAEKSTIDICKEEINMAFNNLLSVDSCFVKSILYHKIINFDEDFSYAYYVQFEDFITKGQLFTPSTFCTIHFSDYQYEHYDAMDDVIESEEDTTSITHSSNDSDNESINSSDDLDDEDITDQEEHDFIIEIFSQRINKRIKSSSSKLFNESSFQKKKLTEYISKNDLYNKTKEEIKSYIDSYKNRIIDDTTSNVKWYENKYVKECKEELEMNGFLDDLTKDALMFLLYDRNLDDFKNSKFSLAYMYHAAMNIELHQFMNQPNLFCIHHEHDVFMKLWFDKSFSETKASNDKIRLCQNLMKNAFGVYRNCKNISDSIILNKTMDNLLKLDLVGEYVVMLNFYLRKGTTKSPGKFCEDHIESKFRTYSNQENKKRKLQISSGEGSSKKPKTIIEQPDNTMIRVEIEKCKLQLESDGFLETLKIMDIIKLAFETKTLSMLNEKIFSSNYLRHIKNTYSISSQMQSVNRFCNNIAK